MSGNPWLDDDPKPRSRWEEDDDEEFDPDKDPSNYFRQVVKRKEIDMVQSTQRSLGLLYESEQIGAETAKELIDQGEKLRATEKRVDKMEQDLKESDRHIQSIKSMWGAFLNKFKKEPAQKPVEVFDDSKPETNSKLSNALTASENAGYPSGSDYDSHPVLAKQRESRQQYGKTDSNAKNERMQEVDQNLDLMLGGLTRLKELGRGLGEEIDEQDKVIVRLTDKVGRVDDKTHQTNKKLMKLNNS